MSQPVAIVTGAGRGIGAATVASLVADGWWVAAVDRCSPHPAIAYPMASTDDLADVVTAADGNAAAFEADVSVGAEMAEVVASVTDARSRLDAVVCAAGVVAGGSPAWEIDDSEWDAVIGTDLTGVLPPPEPPCLRSSLRRMAASSPLRRPPARWDCAT